MTSCQSNGMCLHEIEKGIYKTFIWVEKLAFSETAFYIGSEIVLGRLWEINKHSNFVCVYGLRF